MNTAMADGRKADTERRRQRVLTAIKSAAGHNTPINVSGIARQAGVDRTFLYRHRDLLALVHAAELEPARHGPAGASPVSLTCFRPTSPTPRPATPALHRAGAECTGSYGATLAPSPARRGHRGDRGQPA
jgi:hypothetical protein